jgi:hypothetical protein
VPNSLEKDPMKSMEKSYTALPEGLYASALAALIVVSIACVGTRTREPERRQAACRASGRACFGASKAKAEGVRGRCPA